MNTPIMLTPSDIIGLFLGLCAAVTATAGAVGVIVTLINKAKTPNRMQNERLDKHEEWLKKHDAMLDNDNKRLNNLEKSGTITMKALLALLRHGIDGNDIESMKKVKSELEQYLIDR
jgi:hypothetical protein